jgi:Flp pilus assembly protein TadG
MDEKGAHNERGQTVVIVVFAIIALLAFAGLAIDGGTAYLNRRRMQNAADAASVAGTRELAEALCDNDDGDVTDDVVMAAVNDYALRNGVDSEADVVAHYVKFEGEAVVEYSPPVAVGNGTVPRGAVGVAVTATISRPTYFLGLVGQTTGAASASATGVTGPPRIMGGLRPFGVPRLVINQLNPGDCFTQSFKNCKSDEPDDCPILDDEGDMIGRHRNWLNLNHVWHQNESPNFPRASGGGGSAANLQNWMANGWQGQLFADCPWDTGCRQGDFIHAKPGSSSSAIGDVPIDTLFYVPIYDVVPQYGQIPSPKAGPVPQGGNYYYHIIGFAGISVPPGGADQGGGTIRACLEEVFIGEGQPSPNSGFDSNACTTHTMVVTLWR